ncbi:peptidylprolyl isomerase [Siminovitchia sp. FSL H7-0308]|uniref:Foldase protein PrsA n=1 Tax=Siminovitchia thermophila TaxID=1245522 RepID=A0ABS2R647_9BACI|nr:peptidylprolyl isomerase [Siminovitchia thermophila]MBM7715079.1 foldase protein PrsA [Siminovitchia thermophila]ONK22837.1 peptidylprolyl isomerase [Bacillus sp. VT-16-64]
MKKWVVTLTMAAGIVGLAGCGGQNSDTVAKTSAGNVTKDELYEAMKGKAGEQALQQLVFEKVLSKEYKVSDKEVDKKMDELKEQLGPQFEMALAQSGFKDEDDFRESLKVNLLQEKAAVKDVKVSEKEVKEYYDNKQKELEVRHILVEDEKTAKDVKAKLDQGGDFAALAKEHSVDTAANEQGGSLGTITIDTPQMDQTFIKEAFKLKKDQISNPVQTQFGWHIIQVTNIKEKPKKDVKPFDEVKDDYAHELKVAKLDPETMQEALTKELKKADIKVNDKDLKETFDAMLNDKQDQGDNKKEEEKK